MRFLVDTSVWIDHLRRTDDQLSRLLGQRDVLMHPFVLGELALGHIPNWNALAGDFQDLPRAVVADDDEVLHLIGRSALSGTGIGYIDAHLIASALLIPGTQLWTRDKKLRSVAERLFVAAKLD